MARVKRSFGYIAWVAGALAFAAASCGERVAAEDFRGAEWFFRAWQTEHGLSSNTVTGVGQTLDGRLWVATHSGLMTFDGVEFRSMDLPISSGRVRPIVRGMDLDPEGSMWLALEGSMVARLADGAVELLRRQDGLPARQPSQVVAENGRVAWVSYLGGPVVRLEGGAARVYGAADGPGEPSRQSVLARDASGTVWFARQGALGQLDESGERVARELPAGRNALAAAREGGVWLVNGGDLYRFFGDGAGDADRFALPPEMGGKIVGTILEARDGGLWLGTEGAGLWRFDGQDVEFVDTSHPTILSLTEDREGNVWAGTDGGGLNRLRLRRVNLHAEAEGLPMPIVRSICEDAEGELWATTQQGDLLRYRERRWQRMPLPGTKGGPRALCVTRGQGRDLWVGTEGGGLHRWNGAAWTVYTEEDGFANGYVRALAMSRDGQLWIAQDRPVCVQRFGEGGFETFSLGTGARAARAIAEDDEGRVWFGAIDGRIYRYGAGGLVDLSGDLGGLLRPVRCLLPAEGGGVWIGFAHNGIGWWRDGGLSLVGEQSGLPDPNICAMERDEEGGLWVSSDHGVFRVPELDLKAAASGERAFVRTMSLGRDEGLPNLQGNYGYGPGSLRGRDGRVWFPMRNGLAVVRPDLPLVFDQPLAAVIESVRVDGEAVPGAEMAGVKLDPAHRNLEVRFTAYRFQAPEDVQFRHRLVNWQDEWSDPSGLRRVAFSRLPAGDYRLEISARAAGGVWGEEPAALEFAVEPFYWDRWWFRMFLVGAFAAIVAGAVRFVSFRRLSRRLRSLEQEAALQSERARIAKDIHDDLGSSLTQISLLSRLAEHDLEERTRLSAHLTDISLVARRGVESVDEIVWAVNPRNDTVAHLLEYAGQHAVDFLRAAGVRCRVDMPVSLPATRLRADVRHGVFLVVKESLTNIVKHSGASDVCIFARTQGDTLELIIEDNGSGFVRGEPGEGQDGLSNIEQRLRDMNGACQIESALGKGTKVRISLDLREAAGSGNENRRRTP